MFSKFEGKDAVAIVTILGGFFLLWQGIDTVVGASLLAISAYYFGHQRFKDIVK